MIAKCAFCHLHTRARLDHKLPLGQTLNIHQPGDAWSADFVVIHSELDPPSALVLSDIASNYIVAIPLSDKSTTKQIVSALAQHIIALFGQFLCLGTDAQSSFTSETMTEICALMRVRRFVVSNPMQSSSERAHKYILWMVAALYKDLGITNHVLPVFLSLAALLYNTSVQVKDKFTPFYLMNGFRSPRLNKLVPLSAFLPRRPNVDTDYLRSFIKLHEALWLIS